MMSMMGTGMLITMIFWIVLLGLIIYAIFILVSKNVGKREDSALSLLRERFARGEIEKEEFEQKRMVLSKK